MRHLQRRREGVEAAGAEAGVEAEDCGHWTLGWMKTTSHRKGGDGEEARYQGAEEAEAAGVNEEEEEEEVAEEEGAKH